MLTLIKNLIGAILWLFAYLFAGFLFGVGIKHGYDWYGRRQMNLAGKAVRRIPQPTEKDTTVTLEKEKKS